MLHFFRHEDEAIRSVEQFEDTREAMKFASEVQPVVNQAYLHRQIGFRVVRPLTDAQQVSFYESEERTHLPLIEPAADRIVAEPPQLKTVADIPAYLEFYKDGLPPFNNSF